MQLIDAVLQRSKSTFIDDSTGELGKLYDTHGMGLDRDTFMSLAQTFRDSGMDMSLLTDDGKYDSSSPMGQAFRNIAQKLEWDHSNQEVQASNQEQETQDAIAQANARAEQESQRLQSVSELEALANTPQQQPADDNATFGRVLMAQGQGFGAQRGTRGAQAPLTTQGLARRVLGRNRMVSRMALPGVPGGRR